MVDAAPFRGLRYDPAVAGEPATTSAPAYDDVDPFTYTAHRTTSPYTVLELLTPGDDTETARAAAALRRWRRTGVLVTDPRPAFYRYEEHELRRGVPAVQRGLLAAVALEDPGPDSAILPHEDVAPDRVEQRRQRLEALRVDASPVFALAVGAAGALAAVLARAPSEPPVVAMTDDAGVDHRVWSVTDPSAVDELRRVLASVHVILADGHHRYAAALAARAQHPQPAWQRTLMYVVDAASDGPEVLGVHRLVRGVRPAALRALAEDFVVEAAPADANALRDRLHAAAGPALGLLVSPPLAEVHGGAAALLRPRARARLDERLPAGRSARWRELDTALLDHAVLPRLHVDAVRFRPDLPAAGAEVAAADDAALFVVRPVDVATVEAAATAGDMMPPKTTYFRPKPRAGLVLRPLDEDASR